MMAALGDTRERGTETSAVETEKDMTVLMLWVNTG